jgi:hypothetical protein
MKIMTDYLSQANLTCPTHYLDKLIEKLAESTDKNYLNLRMNVGMNTQLNTPIFNLHSSSSLSVRHLRALLALARTCHFTHAAQSIALSQSAFSAVIQSLEQMVGAKLFVRNTRHVTLTAAGLTFECSAR